MTKRTYTVHSIGPDGKPKVEIYEMGDDMARLIDSSKRWFENQAAKCETGDFDNCIYKSDTVYYDDGGHSECAKHCWACRRCDAVIQVG